jgi:hypothetical protein
MHFVAPWTQPPGATIYLALVSYVPVHISQPTRRHITEDCNLNIHRRETLVSDPQYNLGKLKKKDTSFVAVCSEGSCQKFRDRR